MKDFDVLIDIMRAHYGQRDWQSVTNDVEKIGWKSIADVAVSNGVEPFLYHAFAEGKASLVSVPGNILALWKKHSLAGSIRCAMLEKECNQISNMLKERDIVHVRLKGMAYLNSLYTEHPPKLSSDIDILIHPDDYPAARKCLLDKGYIHYWPDTHLAFFTGGDEVGGGESEAHFTRKSDTFTFNIDLHWEISVSSRFEGYPTRNWLPIQDYPWFACTEDTEDGGNTYRRLRPEMHFLHLVFHFGPHHHFNGLKWLFELCRFLEVYGDTMDWEHIEKTVSEKNCRRIFGLVLRMIYGITGDAVPAAGRWRTFWTNTREWEYQFFLHNLSIGALSTFRQYCSMVLLGGSWQEKWKMLSYILFDPNAVRRFRGNRMYRICAPIVQPFYLLLRMGFYRLVGQKRAEEDYK